MPKSAGVVRRQHRPTNSSTNADFGHRPSPNPNPARGIYGFVLYLAARVFFIVYLIWALVPDYLLKALHLTYLPAKYWAVAVPSFALILILTYLVASFFLNLINFHALFDEESAELHLQNDFLD